MFKIKAPDGTNNLCGKKLKHMRLERKLSQRAIAAKLQLMGYDVDHYLIHRIENGERFITDIELKMFSEFFEADINDFFN